MFQITQQIIEETENHILQVPNKNKVWIFVTRFLFFPFKYLTLGLKELFKPASLWFFFAIILVVIISVIKQKIEIKSELSLVLTYLSFFIPMILVIFAMPSTYAYDGIKIECIERIASLLDKKGLDTIEKVELLEENIEKIYLRILSRINFYKWLIGIFWTLYIIVLNIEFRIALKLEEKILQQMFQDNFVSFILIIISTLSAFVLVVGYKRASEILIKSIQFGCVEYKHRILILSNNCVNSDL